MNAYLLEIAVGIFNNKSFASDPSMLYSILIL